ncbi:MAG: hypothetical protein K6E84_03475, partial [Lachnospiraceae bacterium]|nr:hypothetical protein [Lachnospiraceae bacterium]
GYIVYRKLASGGSWKKLKTIKKKATVTYVDKKAKTGKNYVYTVLAYKKVKGKQIKGAMNSKGKKTMAVCAAPRMEVTRIKTDSNEVVLWNPDGVTGYYLYRKTGNGSYTKIKTIPASKIDVTVYFDPVDSSYIYTYYAVPYSKVGSKKVKGYKTGEITEKRLNAKK